MTSPAHNTSSELAPQPTRAEQERDFYRKLLELGQAEEIRPFLAEALALIVQLTGARLGYVELRTDPDARDDPPFWVAHGCEEDDIAGIRASLSSGVIGEALATGRTIITLSALLDSRFSSNLSVKRNRIEAVICSPVGSAPPVGVVYLQDRVARDMFTEDDRLRVETFARHLAPYTERLLLRQRRHEDDPTLPFRRNLRADGVVGRSAAFARVLQQAAVAAPLDVTVLLTGPSGTGKTQLARVIHESGPRAKRPFVELNCAALPDNLIESELFGAMPGAHSTASRKIDGKVAVAEGGTLFLDEIGELTMAAQSKLLQLLQSKEYYPLGGTRPLRADVRVIAATNVDIKSAVQRKTFREDLFYRLQVLPIRIPGLSERREDVKLLAEYFCAEATKRHGFSSNLALSIDALYAIESAEWNGNARELAHAIEAATIRATGEGASRIERDHVFPFDVAVAARSDAPTSQLVPAKIESYKGVSFQEATRRFQADLLRAILEENGWNVTEAAERLDLARSHAYKLVRAFGLSGNKK